MKRNRNAHRKILTITAMAMCAADPDSLRIREANRSFVNLFGYSLREALTLTLHDLTAQDRESVDYTCKIALPTHKVLPPVSLTALRKDGGTVVVECRLEWILLRDGPIIFASLRNLSEHKENRFLKILQETSRDILRRRDRDEVLHSLLRRAAVDGIGCGVSRGSLEGYSGRTPYYSVSDLRIPATVGLVPHSNGRRTGRSSMANW